jgi:hypothetical protein
MNSFEKELTNLINRHSKENDSDTPDFILANYINKCLENYNSTIKQRDNWFGIDPWKNKLNISGISFVHDQQKSPADIFNTEKTPKY